MSLTDRVKKADMLEGPCLKTIVLFSLPILLGNVFQLCYNLVDTMVVGRFVGANALAAVGSCGTLITLLVNSMVGFSTGASVVAAQFRGAGLNHRIKATASTTLCFLLILSLAFTLFSFFLAGQIMHWLSVPEEVYADTVLYFRIYVLGLIFTSLYNFFASFLRALGDSTTPLIFLVISSLLNIAGDLVFVLALHWGVAGVGLATVIAQGVSVLLCAVYGYRGTEYFRFGRGEFVIDRSLLKDVLRLGLPAGLQNTVSHLGNVLVQRLINSYGAVAMASYAATMRLEQICNIPMNSVSLGMSVFVGQNVGAGKQDRVKKGLWQTLLLSMTMCVVLALFVFFCSEELMCLFVNRTETEVIRVGVAFTRRWALLVFLHGLTYTFLSFLRGVGDSIHAMIGLFVDLMVRMATAFFFALGLGMGFLGIAYSLPCGWACCSVYTILRYLSGKWKDKAVVKQNENGA